MKFWLWLFKIDRWARWLLGLSILLYFISGFGLMTGLISRPLASWLHFRFLIWPTLATLLIHVGAGLRVQLVRWRQDKNLWLTLVLYAALIIPIVYFARLAAR